MTIGRAQLPSPRRRLKGQRRTGNELRVNRKSLSTATVISPAIRVRDTTPLVSPAPVLASHVEREQSLRAPRTYLAVALDVTGKVGRRRDVLRLFRHWTAKLGIVASGPIQAEGGRFWFAVDGRSDDLQRLLKMPFIACWQMTMEGAVPSAAPTIGRKQAPKESKAKRRPWTIEKQQRQDRAVKDLSSSPLEPVIAQQDGGAWAMQTELLSVADKQTFYGRATCGFASLSSCIEPLHFDI